MVTLSSFEIGDSQLEDAFAVRTKYQVPPPKGPLPFVRIDPSGTLKVDG